MAKAKMTAEEQANETAEVAGAAFALSVVNAGAIILLSVAVIVGCVYVGSKVQPT